MPLHQIHCRCRTCAPLPLGHGQRTIAALLYGPGALGLAALFFILVTR